MKHIAKFFDHPYTLIFRLMMNTAIGVLGIFWQDYTLVFLGWLGCALNSTSILNKLDDAKETMKRCEEKTYYD